MKREEQIKSKLSELTAILKRWEKEYKNDPKEKWLHIQNELKAKIEMLKWILII